ncbi:MAG: AAA family ATPase, partial [Chloroflexi bacterium]|nr:AAA family ATPase [Chloroflexota bacterium]
DWAAAINNLRGEFLEGADLPSTPEYEMWVLQERQRWRRAALELLQRLVKVEAEAGRLHEAIVYAQRYLALDELAETMHVRLMELYAALGERGAALQQYERCVSILERELGVDPSPATRAAYATILQGAARSTPAPSLSWTTLPTLEAPHVERELLLAELTRLLNRATRNRGGLVFISGEAGVGKSRLLQEFGEQSRSRATVLYGAATPARHPLPYEALVHALRAALDLPALRALSSSWLTELTVLLPELRERAPTPAPRRSADDPHDRTRLFEALRQAFHALARPHRPLLLCLDDMHWADAATRDWLLYWGPHLRRAPILVLLAYRSEEDEPLQTWIRRLRRHGVAHSLFLEGLSLEGVGRLLDHAGLSALRSEQKRRLWVATGGNPFFVLEIARALLERPTASSLVPDAWPLPDSVAQVIASRLVSLSPKAMQMLETAAILHEFTFDAARITSGLPEMEALEGLEELVGRRLLSFGGARYRFVHELIRRVALDRMSADRRRALHRRAGLALSQSTDAPVERVAQHFDAGGDLEKALFYYHKAAHRATTVCAWNAAETAYARMLDMLDEMDPTRTRPAARQQRCRILVERANLYYLQGRLHRRDADLDAMLALANDAQDPNLFFHALAVRARYDNLDGDYQATLRTVQQALSHPAAVPSRQHLSRLYAQQGFAYYFLGRPQQALEALEQAAQAAQAIDDSAAHGRIAQFKGYVYYHMAQYERALTQHRRALHYHKMLGDQNRMAWDLTDMGTMCMLLLRFQEAEAHTQRALQLGREIGSQPAESYALNNLGRLYALRGRFDQAIQCHEASLELQRATGSRRGEAAALIYAAQAYYQAGDEDTAAQRVGAAIDICRRIEYGLGLVRALTLQALLQKNDLSRAQESANEALRLAKAIRAPHEQIHARLALAQLTLLAEEGEVARVHAREAEAQAESLGLVLERARARMWAGLACLQMGETEMAAAYTEAAVELLASIGEPLAVEKDIWLARARALAAVGDRDGAARVMSRSRAASWRMARTIEDAHLRRRFWERRHAMRRWTARLQFPFAPNTNAPWRDHDQQPRKKTQVIS